MRLDMNSSLRFVVRTFLVASLGLALALPAAAQAPPPGSDKGVSISKVERKNRAPVSNDILRVKLPKPVEATLDNGLVVMILEDHRLPNVSVTLNIGVAGALFEPPELPGLASFTAQMLREGTKTRNSKQIADETDRLGASIFPGAGFTSASTTITASGLSDNFDEWFSLMTDILLNPSFPADELEKLKGRQKTQLLQARTQPGFLANERYNRALYGSHPAAVTATTLAAIDAITPEKLAAWHREHCAPQNAVLGIAGDVNAKELLPKLKKWFSAWAKTDLKEVMPANPTPPAAKKIFLVDRPNSVQTTLLLGNLTIDRKDPDYIPMVVMNRVVGGGAAARLFINLREEKGYTYGAGSDFSPLKYPGAWTASSDVRSEVTDGAMTEFMKEINRIRDEKVPAAELADSERSLVANFALSLENPSQLLFYAIVRKLYGFPEDYWDTYPAKIAAVSAEEVQRVAQKYIQPAALQIVAVGDAKKIKDVMDKFGPVEVYDLEGKPVVAKPAPASPGN